MRPRRPDRELSEEDENRLYPGFSDFSLALLRGRKLIAPRFRFKRLGLVPYVEGNSNPRPHSISRGDRSAHGHDPYKQARRAGPRQSPQQSPKGVIRPRSSTAVGQAIPASLGGLDGYLVAPLFVATLPLFPRAMRGHQLVPVGILDLDPPLVIHIDVRAVVDTDFDRVWPIRRELEVGYVVSAARLRDPVVPVLP
jgi:hypothetical protein